MAASANPRARLEHILFHIRGIKETVAGIDYDIFITVYHMERTVERAVQIISEAVKSLPSEMTAAWEKIEGIGNILRHEYQRIDPETMWRIAKEELPRLEIVVRRMLAEIDR
jgi:uncharacterized protein with HEPN domain